MKGVISFIREAHWGSMAVAVVAGVLFVTMVANATTTISTDIVTGGGVYATSSANIDGAVTLGSTLSVAGNVTVTGASKTLNITTANTATSTVIVGCVQTYATSTATPISMVFNSISTTTTMLNGQSNNGFVLWTYGSCPR